MIKTWLAIVASLILLAFSLFLILICVAQFVHSSPADPFVKAKEVSMAKGTLDPNDWKALSITDKDDTIYTVGYQPYKSIIGLFCMDKEQRLTAFFYFETEGLYKVLLFRPGMGAAQINIIPKEQAADAASIILQHMIDLGAFKEVK